MRWRALTSQYSTLAADLDVVTPGTLRCKSYPYNVSPQTLSPTTQYGSDVSSRHKRAGCSPHTNGIPAKVASGQGWRGATTHRES
jgi:hypothetical protein